MFWLNDIVYDIVYNIIYDHDTVHDIVYFMLTLHFHVQDCVCLVAPYPYRLQQLEDFDPIGDLDVEVWQDVSA